MSVMYCLSIQQPWLDRILFEGKDVENRTWALPRWVVGQRVLLHAGKKAQHGYGGKKERLGAILGEVTVTGCVTQSPSPWFEGPYGFTLSKPVSYDTPIPYPGRLGFFKVELPPEDLQELAHVAGCPGGRRPPPEEQVETEANSPGAGAPAELA